ncbi:MAG TPA: hypothetical protein VN823_05400 [Stellaceae bacterium]|nr:hypothetical protein [Stellaceae bacterium]
MAGTSLNKSGHDDNGGPVERSDVIAHIQDPEGFRQVIKPFLGLRG